MKKIILPALCLLFAVQSYCQDAIFAKGIVDTLTSSFFWGRGYTNNGMQKAADYLAAQMQSLGLQPMSGKNYLQPLSYPVNTFPGNMQVSINGKELEPGKDFIISPESRSAKASGNLVKQDSITYVDPINRIIISLQPKLTWSVAPEQADYTRIMVDKNRVTGTPVSIQLNIETKLVSKFKTANVCGIIKGTKKPDSILVFTAHYDHLGGMGKDVYFPGANDNASGISMLLGLAKYYAAHPPEYSIGFICFAGEEAGLVGSKYFTENPAIPLSKIRFLLNVDLVGTGDDGITVVNATEFAKEFSALNEVNNGGNFMKKINARGKAANSDHYWFSEKNVPSFFIYTLGGIAAYHDVFDKGITLPLNTYENLLNLIVGFYGKLMN